MRAKNLCTYVEIENDGKRTQEKVLDPKKITEVFDLAIAFYGTLLEQEKGQWVNWGLYNDSKNIVKPYAQRLMVNPDDQLIMHGDLHGDIHSVCAFLKQLQDDKVIDDHFKIIKPQTYLLFLGDYVDRGKHGTEVLYTILRLKMANPEKCILVRGNHETEDISRDHGFKEELEKKYGNNATSLFSFVCKLYELLPVVLFVDKKELQECIQCCHGGIEIEYIPDALLKSDKKYEYIESYDLNKRADLLENLSQDQRLNVYHPIISSKKSAITKYTTNKQPLYWGVGFLWNLFSVKPGIQDLDFTNAAWKFSQQMTNAWRVIPQKNIVGFFRAHQHSDGQMMELLVRKEKTRGAARLWEPDNWQDVTKLWNGIVVTFNICPSTSNAHGEKSYYDTYGVLTVGKGKFANDWRLDVYNKKMFDSAWKLVADQSGNYKTGVGSEESVVAPKERDIVAKADDVVASVLNFTHETITLRTTGEHAETKECLSQKQCDIVIAKMYDITRDETGQKTASVYSTLYISNSAKTEAIEYKRNTTSYTPSGNNKTPWIPVFYNKKTGRFTFDKFDKSHSKGDVENIIKQNGVL